jgi:hypothetical protein
VVWYQNRRTNLHALWDSRMIASRGLSEDQWVTRIEQRMRAHGDLRRIAAGSVAAWTLESHDLARDVVYPRLSPWLIVTEGYVDVALPVVEEQLVRAAVRLAAVLNAALD